MNPRAAHNAWVEQAKSASLADAISIINPQGLKRSGTELVGPCPACGGKDRFSVNYAKGKWNCRGAVGGADAIGLVMHCEGIGFLAACERLNGEPPPGGRVRELTPAEKQERERIRKRRESAESKRKEEAERDQQRRFYTAREIWLGSGPLGGAPARYLTLRGINTDFADDQIRAHPGLRHPEGGTFPALVARIASPDGKGTGVWRIYVKADGSGKAPVENPKRGLGVATGGACRIGGIWPRVAVAEGIETALAVRELVPGKIPVWAALSTSGMRGLVLPQEIESVDIFADGDPPKSPRGERKCWMASPGISAANELKKRLEEEGRHVTVQLPPVGRDWNDVLVSAKKIEAA